LIADDGVHGFGYADPLFCRTFREIVAADLIILAGAAIDFHTCFGRQQLMAPDVKIMQVGEDPVLLNQCRQSHLAVLAQPVACLQAVAQAWETEGSPGKWDDWLNYIRKRYAENREIWGTMLQEFGNADESIHPLQVCA